MPASRDCSQSEGKTEPASANLSPVARDYPSRALRGFFMPATLPPIRISRRIWYQFQLAWGRSPLFT
jgi:hypothetical protein